MASVNFLYRSIKEKSTLKARLLYRYEGKDYQFEEDSKILVTKEYWSKFHKRNVKDQKIKNLQKEIRDQISSLELYILREFNNTDSKYIDKAWLSSTIDKNYGHGNAFKSEYLINIAEEYIEYIKLNVSKSTISKHKTVRNKLNNMESRYSKRYKVSDVDKNFLKVFKDYFQDKGYAQNTIKKFFDIIKTYCYYARDNGIEIYPNLKKLGFVGEDSDSIYLTLDELKAIEEYKGLSDKYDNVRDWLIIGCFTAQRISDFSRFAREMIMEIESQKLISFKQTKGQKEIVIPLLPEVQKILNKRGGEFPRKISNQNFNKYVKELCKMVGFIEKVNGSIQLNIGTEKDKKFRKVKGIYPKYMLVSSHIGRRSFATNFYGKIPTPLLMSATGHTTEKQFLEYIKKGAVDSALDLAKRYLELK